MQQCALSGWHVDADRVHKLSFDVMLSDAPEASDIFRRNDNSIIRSPPFARRILAAEAERLMGIKPEATNNLKVAHSEPLQVRESRRIELIRNSPSMLLVRFLMKAMWPWAFDPTPMQK